MLFKAHIQGVLAILSLILVFGNGEKAKIGIIGAGIGGTSTAYFLRELFEDSADIDIFEKSQVGGRLAPVTIGDHSYNAGGTILHISNLYMRNFTEILGLNRDDNAEDGRLGIFDGEQMLLTTSDWTVVTLGKLFWRYGMDLYNIRSWVRDKLIAPIKRLYEIQRGGHAFSTVEDMFAAMDPSMVDWTKKSIRTLLKEEGFSDRFIEEFVFGVTRVNYGQTPDIHGLVGAVSLAGAEPGLWNVIGGNQEVPKGLLRKSGANHIRAEVKTVSLIEDDPPLYQVDYLPSGSKAGDDLKSKEYDIVIMAAPMYKGRTNIKFEDFQKDIEPVNYDFHLTVTSFLEGNPNLTTFGIDNLEDFPSIVLTSNDKQLINYMAKMKPVVPATTEKPVYRLFTNKVPKESEFRDYIPEWSDIRMVNWYAYPEYPSSVELPSFTLHSQLYHINAIEMASSCMEMSAVGAKNVALLAYYRWTGQYDKIDEVISPGSDDQTKAEL